MRQRPDITNNRVKELFKKHQNKSHVATILECSHRLVSDALDGSRKDPPHQGVKKQPIRKDTKKCSCCQSKSVKRGNYFLCSKCETKSFGFEEHSCNIPKPMKPSNID